MSADYNNSSLMRVRRSWGTWGGPGRRIREWENRYESENEEG
jgi:hypothetical protein